MKYLDNNGLSYLWQKIKAKINSSGLLNESVIGWNGGTIPEGYEEITDPNIALKQDIYNSMFPIGRGFIDFTGTDFTNYLGFKWQRELVGMFPVGYNPNDTSFNSIGKTGGEKTHTLTVNEMPSHTHIQNAHNHTQNPHGHSVTANGAWQSGQARRLKFEDSNQTNTLWVDSTTATNNATTATNQNTGGSQAHNNLPPYQVVSYWKRVA